MTSRILIVEDDPLVAMMIEGFLDAIGREVAGSEETLAGALLRIAAVDFDAVIVDVHLANGETSEPVAAALREAGISFIVTTGDAVIVGPTFTGAPVLRKPFTIATLETALAEIGA